MFELIRSERSTDPLLPEGKEKSDSNNSTRQSEKEDVLLTGSCLDETEAGKRIVSASGKDNSSKSVPFELYKRRTTVIVMRQTFLNIVCDALAEYKYVGRNQRADLILACR